ncbi:hypothetical protein [Okeania sp. KiyG1]|nr:hypothetical protein [Okeania sp. KiyG1]
MVYYIIAKAIAANIFPSNSFVILPIPNINDFWNLLYSSRHYS